MNNKQTKFQLAKKQAKFQVDTPFPIPAGDTWQAIKDQHAVQSNSTNSEYLHARSVDTMNHWSYMQAVLNFKVEKTGEYMDTALERMRSNLKYEFENKSKLNSEFAQCTKPDSQSARVADQRIYSTS